MYAWINANAASNAEWVNKREAPSKAAKAVGNLTTLGELVNMITAVEIEGHRWIQYYSVDGQGTCFWVRSDVHKVAYLEQEELVLDVLYVSQNEPDTAFTDNDCGPASCVGLLETQQVVTTVPKFMRDAGINHKNTTQYWELRRGVQANGKDLLHIRPMHFSDILEHITIQKQPVMALLYRHHLKPGKHYGHFMNVIGYRIRDQKLYVVVHDSDGEPCTEYSAEQFVLALGNVKGNNNLPFQGMVIQ